MPKPKRKPLKPKVFKKPRLELRIAKVLDALNQLPEGAFNKREKSVLARVDGIMRKIVGGKLTEADLVNVRDILRRKEIIR